MRTTSPEYATSCPGDSPVSFANSAPSNSAPNEPTKWCERLASIRPRHALTIVCLLPRAEASSNLRRHSFCCRFEEEERGRGGGESLARGVRKLTAATRGARAPEPVGAEQLGEGVLTLPPLHSLPPHPPPPGKEWYCTQHLRHLRQLHLTATSTATHIATAITAAAITSMPVQPETPDFAHRITRRHPRAGVGLG